MSNNHKLEGPLIKGPLARFGIKYRYDLRIFNRLYAVAYSSAPAQSYYFGIVNKNKCPIILTFSFQIYLLHNMLGNTINMDQITQSNNQGRSYRKILGGADIPSSFGTLLSYIPFLSRIVQKIFD